MQRLRQGIVLVVVGVVLYFLVREQGTGGGVTLALIGSAFLVAHALTGQGGYLVPGGLMTGLGVGIDWPAAWGDFHGSTVLVGLGLGLILIRVASRREGDWALVPGVVLLFVGVLTGVTDIMAFLSLWWPAAVAVAGLWVMLSNSRNPQ